MKIPVSRLKRFRVKARRWVRANRNVALAVLPGFGLNALLVSPKSAPLSILTFSLGIDGLLDIAESFFNGLSPIVQVIGGIVLGFGLIAMVLGLIMKAVKTKG